MRFSFGSELDIAADIVGLAAGTGHLHQPAHCCVGKADCEDSADGTHFCIGFGVEARFIVLRQPSLQLLLAIIVHDECSHPVLQGTCKPKVICKSNLPTLY
jgi:hypothetical protein